MYAVMKSHYAYPGMRWGPSSCLSTYGKPRIIGYVNQWYIQYKMARRVVAFARASYPCEADNEHELSFVRGDVLDIFECGNDGWWTAKLGGREGLVPQQYIKPVQSVDAVLHFIRLYYSDRPNIFIRKDVNADAVQQVKQLLGGGFKHVVLVQHLYKCNAYGACASRESRDVKARSAIDSNFSCIIQLSQLILTLVAVVTLKIPWHRCTSCLSPKWLICLT